MLGVHLVCSWWGWIRLLEIRAVDGADNSIYRWVLREKDEFGSQNFHQDVEGGVG